MFRRDTKAGSLYWLGLSDKTGTYLDGNKSYKLTVPLPAFDGAWKPADFEEV
jgi:hypothetical protein